MLFQTRKICAELLKHVIVYSDASNVAVGAYTIKLKRIPLGVRIVQNRSMKMELQRMAMDIFSVCVQKGIIIDIQWIPRQENVKADYISNTIDFEDIGELQTSFSNS